MADHLSENLASLKIDRAAPPPSGGHAKWVWLGVVVALAGGGLALWPTVEASLFKTSVEFTSIASVSPAQGSVQLTAAGYVQAAIASRVAPKVPGRVLKVHIVQGQKVEAGQPLIELDPADDEANIAAAKARVAAAWAQAKGAQARVATAEADLNETRIRASRERKLADSGAIATAGAEDLESRMASLGENVKAAKATAVASAAEAAALNSQVEVLKTGLKNLTLTAPINGTVINKPPQIGEFVGPQPAGMAVDMGGIRVADFGTLQVDTDIPEGRLGQVKLGAPAEIVLDAYPGQRFRGRVKEITPQVDRSKATVIVKVAFVDPTEGVLPDMSARVSFLTEELNEAALKAPPKIVVPGSAVTERSGSKVVFVVEGDKVRMVPVKLGASFGDGFELASGPSPGTQVVKEPPATLADGQKVKQQEAAQ